ncbi:hypothetical protein [Streptomyces eurythermus]|uniref:hypothetical protein n=1 Tax=Streptomyces eurythermus TaxID=42237 RepID=UPI0033F42A1C
MATIPFVYRFFASVRLARSLITAGGRGPWLPHGSYLQDWLASPDADNWREDASRGGGSPVRAPPLAPGPDRHAPLTPVKGALVPNWSSK